ncbi:p-hydroxycinnamoyl CoA hydratase/lyase [Oceanibacterium hippocampi]|uniref:Hydroxycinnamoyl-CoA hydratase-lyase n=1 Tax=Oceanibacterium hippocampi TaxID=745714 RepID=A0A1Y5TX34_9PROT|nr:p-hydroxycinnamoyl CoA hydratase/lyase [Oceanibacterium hippocampi]SLN75510.1 Hydroxycinnamoyl-CoA hydratase-lyase [Oceanibacterium hippocampi]
MSAPKREFVKVEKQDGIAWTYLNRPHKKNAMSPGLHLEMHATLDELEADPETKVVVIAGADGVFSAGQDLKEYFRDLDENPAEAKRIRGISNRWQWDRLYMFDKPTIAMVEGFCVGGAFTHMLATDFAIACEDTTFSLSEVNWGILPGGMVSKALADAVPLRQALYYACLGDPFDGKEAARIGLITYAVPKELIREEVTKLAHKLMSKSPAALRATKQVIRQVRQMDFGQAADYMQVKKDAIRVSDPENSYNTGLQQFIDEKSYKPVYAPFKKRDEREKG